MPLTQTQAESNNHLCALSLILWWNT